MPPSYSCPDCPKKCKSDRGLTQHRNSKHRKFTPVPEGDDEFEKRAFHYQRHPHLTANPCDADGNFLPPHTPPLPPPELPIDGQDPGAWAPFDDRASFDFAQFHFVKAQSSKGQIYEALDMWAANVLQYDGETPWKTADELYGTIDEIQHGDTPWIVYNMRYTGPLPQGTPPKWMTETYQLVTRDSRLLLHQQIASPHFKDAFHHVPYRQFGGNGDRIWSNLMSADWSWKQADIIAEDPNMHGSMFISVIAGSDKTTVSVATGHQEYHPVYQSPGNITNIGRRAHGIGVLPVAFLAIPKTSKRQRKRPAFQKFARQLYHASLARVWEPLKAGMTTPEVVRCADGHFRRAVYGLGPYIADYPEQVWLAAVVQGWCPKCTAPPDDLDAPGARRRSHEKTDYLLRNWDPGTLWNDYGVRSDVVPFTHGFPRADIHELLSPDLLHQLIKGTFKDHLVSWINDYLMEEHGEAQALIIIQDIDRRIAAVPSFPGLRRFPDGRDFTQWTGDDSKALMKVYLSAIAGHVPSEMVQAMSAFLDFCYIVRRNAITGSDFDTLQLLLDRFHHYREIFVTTGTRADLSLPRQHSMTHYIRGIQLFGSPNGLCSSITESKHIKAVKEPWRRSNRYNALSQMLRTISRLDKMAAIRESFEERGMMEGTTSSYTLMILDGGHTQARVPAEEREDNNDADLGPVTGPKTLSSMALARTPVRKVPKTLGGLAAHIEQPRLPEALRRFLHNHENPDRDRLVYVPLDDCPNFSGSISIYYSAVARFYAPSDLCGAGGMYQERIRSNPDWYGEYSRYDTVFVETQAEAEAPGMAGMVIARVLLFFSFSFRGEYFQCALVHWLLPWGNAPDDETGMWVVRPEYEHIGRRSLEVIPIAAIVRGAHLLPAYGSSCLPEDFHFSQSLDSFRSYYVNKFADHHTHEFLS